MSRLGNVLTYLGIRLNLQVDSGLTFECGKIRFQFMFDIKTPRRVYYLAAEGEEDMNTWVELVCRVCGLHNFSSESEEGKAEVGEVDTGSVSAVTSQPTISGPYMHLSGQLSELSLVLFLHDQYASLWLISSSFFLSKK